MDTEEFDRWTRRTFGRVAGKTFAGLALFGIASGTDASATGNNKSKSKHKKRHKKRCRNLGQSCTAGGTRACCGGRTCAAVGSDGAPETFCCLGNAESCQSDRDCCSPSFCDPTEKTCFFIISDRTQKANFGSIHGRDMLRRVSELPISTWNYTADDPAVRHIGPMAQDFAALFGVGADDRSIHPMDGQGVALAAIQGLMDHITELQAENHRLAARLTALEARRD